MKELTPWYTEVRGFWSLPNIALILPGREVSTGRQVAIKKIKVGQFKDGLDMSAIREVKYLRELKHQNVIEVRIDLLLNLLFNGLKCHSSWMYFLQKRI